MTQRPVTTGIANALPDELERVADRGRALRRWQRPRTRALITYLVLIPICFLWIYPFLWMMSASLKTEQEIYSGLGLLPDAPKWENYARAGTWRAWSSTSSTR